MINFIKEALRKLKSYLSLKFKCFCFVDVVSGERVNMYMDCYGDRYLKSSKWSFFYVRTGDK